MWRREAASKLSAPLQVIDASPAGWVANGLRAQVELLGTPLDHVSYTTMEDLHDYQPTGSRTTNSAFCTATGGEVDLALVDARERDRLLQDVGYAVFVGLAVPGEPVAGLEEGLRVQRGPWFGQDVDPFVVGVVPPPAGDARRNDRLLFVTEPSIIFGPDRRDVVRSSEVGSE
jgi:hypothetical protein